MKNLKLNVKVAQSITTESPIVQEENNKLSKLECTEITEHIYLSSYHKATDHEFLTKLGITHIINCAGNSKNFKKVFFDDLKYLILDIRDEPGYDLIHSIFLTIDFIEKCILNGTKVLIHCFEVRLKLT
jgi:hypothetical protein